MPRSARRTSCSAALLLGVAVVAAGCQTSVGSWWSVLVGLDSPPIGSPPPFATATAAATPGPTGSSAYPVEQASIYDPDLTLNLPVRWTTMSMDTYRSLIVTIREIAPAKMKALYTDQLKVVDSGAVRLVASGPSGFKPWTATILIEVDEGDRSLEAAVARVKKLVAASSPLTNLEQRHITFSFGECERLVMTQAFPPDAPAGSIPARAIVYVIRLVDGRTLLVEASGPEAAQGFDSLIDASVMTLAER
jgi:hypothetical protein